MISVKDIHACNNAAFGGGEEGKERQEKIYEMKIAIVGMDITGQMITAMLTSLGVGTLYLFDNSVSVDSKDKGFLYDRSKRILGKKRSTLIKDELEKINPSANIYSRHGRFCEAFMYGSIPNVVIDATNDSSNKKKMIRYTLKGRNKIPFMSISSDDKKGLLGVHYPRNKSAIPLFDEHPNLEMLVHENMGEQTGFTSCLISGIAAEEVRKIAFRYNERDKLLESNNLIKYNPYSSTRSGFADNIRKNRIPRYRNKKVLVAGAGALGNFAEICLAYLGLGRVDFIDFDIAEEKNLNRQIEFRGMLMEKKAKVLSERIKMLDPYVQSDFYDARLGEVELPDYDAILGCLDNKQARMWLDRYSISKGVPYIDGGTHPKEGQVAVYVPGITESVGKQLSLESFPEKGNACSGPNPSVVMSNAIIASAMVGELIHVLDHPLNPILSGRFNYSTMMQQRFYVERVK